MLLRALRADLLRALPELRRAPADLVEALDLALSFEAWDRLRTDQRLGRDRARDAMLRTVFALLGTASAAAGNTGQKAPDPRASRPQRIPRRLEKP